VLGGVADAAGVHGGTGCGGGGEDIVAAEVVARQRSAEVGGDSGTGVDMLGGRELPTPPALSKWTYSTVKLSDVGVKFSEELPSTGHVMGGVGVEAPPISLVIVGAVAEEGVCSRLIKVEESRCGRCRWR
jgi:hypothetical protein